MYQGLVPVFGDEEFMRIFLRANEALIPQPKYVMLDMRYRYKTSSWLKTAFEWVLSGSLGLRLEQKLKQRQIRRIEEGLLKASGAHKLRTIVMTGNKEGRYELPPLIRYNDNELQFHPDSAVIEVN